ncbi:MAG: allantoate amidohydrolase [Cellulomonadaceae bacterium]|nr:allantoate amidohydrolase [Cellulomonadaceae bacterium]
MSLTSPVRPTVVSLLAQIADVGLEHDGYRRLVHSDAEIECRAWFVEHAIGLGLDVETDRNGNLWAWWGHDLPGSVLAIGSHLDSVPGGGAFDGPLGVAAALDAVALLRAEGWTPTRPLAVVVFADEEGGRFGIACAGSRLLTGVLEPDRARALTDVDGVTMAQAAARAGQDPALLGAEPQRVARLGAYLEVHVEQGHAPVVGGCHAGAAGLAAAGVPVGLVSEIWPHGRWRIDLHGQANHAGTTPLHLRHDPMLGLARAVLEVRAAAERHGVLATVGKVLVEPGAVNAIPTGATLWVDARGADAERVHAAVRDVEEVAGVGAVLESWTASTTFDAGLAAVLQAPIAAALTQLGVDEIPLLPTGAGHDAGILAQAGVPTAMILVRNVTGISHAPGEHADDADCLAGAAALAAAVRSQPGADA